MIISAVSQGAGKCGLVGENEITNESPAQNRTVKAIANIPNGGLL